MSESAKLLVAVSDGASMAIVVRVVGKLAESEVLNMGVDCSEHPGLDEPPDESGLHAWEGVVALPLTHEETGDRTLDWTGAWRPLQAHEWYRLANGLPLWGDR